MIGHRASELVEARLQAQGDHVSLAGERAGNQIRLRLTDLPNPEVVLVLAEVDELEADEAGFDVRPRQPVLELDGDDLDARERCSSLRRNDACGRGEAEEDDGSFHFSSGTRAYAFARGTIGVASVENHCSSSEQ